MVVRAFVIAPSEPMVAAIVGSLRTAGFDAAGAIDPRGIRDFVAAAPAHALLVTENFPRPSPEQLAEAMRPALPDCAFVLVTRETVAIAPDSRFHGRVRYPIPDKLFANAIQRAIHARSASAGDHRALQAEIEIRSLRVDEQTHYEVLGVSHTAGVDTIVAAYDRLSLMFHPDRVRVLEAHDRDRALTVYLRVGEAYRILRNQNERMRYDMKLETGVDTARADGGPQQLADLSRVPSARKYLDLAHKALATGNRTMALAHLRFALTQDPENVLVKRRLAEIEAG